MLGRGWKSNLSASDVNVLVIMFYFPGFSKDSVIVLPCCRTALSRFSYTGILLLTRAFSHSSLIVR